MMDIALEEVRKRISEIQVQKCDSKQHCTAYGQDFMLNFHRHCVKGEL